LNASSNFHGKGYWALILGGSSGMGLATAQQLGASGMHLFIVHRDSRARETELQQLFDGIRANGVQVQTFNVNALQDESRTAVMEAIKQQLQPGQGIRLLLHSIARGNLKKLYDTAAPTLSAEDLQLTIHAMGTSLWQWVQDALQQGLFAADARVIGLTSEGGSKAWPGYAAVGAAKAALENLIRSMAVELAPLGLRCNIVQPGVTDTPALGMIPGNEQLKAMALQRNPFQRLTTPQDVANIIYLLCTDEAAWINGALLHADGGEHCC
jgi:enoyl-[acyl-carrier protein] reductase III